MQNIKKRYDEAVSKLTNRVEVLEAENEQDKAVLSELEEAYKVAVIEDNGRVAGLKRNINTKQTLVNDRKEQIDLLKEEIKPVVTKAANAFAREYARERNKQAAKAEKAKARIKKAKAAYIEAVAKAQKEDTEATDQRWEMRLLLKRADDSVIQKLGLENDRDEWEYQKFESFFHLYDYLIHHEEIHEKLRKL